VFTGGNRENSRLEAVLPHGISRATPAKLVPRRDALVRLRAAAERDFAQRAEAGEFGKAHKSPRRCNQAGVCCGSAV
jgi:hypothetical protein